ncbi:cylicin-1-like [Lytechinus pictus]|uniref:cylicin-1-like n=1 Tax=Lytechinus pictus TaxID=7653 RepID=UPI0030B9C9F2
MPAKRRQRAKVRGKVTRSKDLSSEDMDSQDQLNEITNRLAKKQLKSSTDTEVEHQEQKENHGKRLQGDGYDADFETSEFSTASAGSDMDYQTQPSKPTDSFRSVLSPSQGSSGKRKGNKQGNLQKQVVMRQSQQMGQNRSKSSNSSRNQQTQSRRQSKRKTRSTDSSKGPSEYSSMASSSLLKSPEMMFSLPNGSDSSTPLSGGPDSKAEMNDSCFGFEGLLSPPQQQPLPFSPVLPESPTYMVDSLATSPTLNRKEEVEEDEVDVQDAPLSPSPSDNLVLRLSPSPERAIPESSSMYSSMDSKSHASSRGGQKRKVDVKLTSLIHKEDEKVPPKKTVKRRKTQKKKEEDAWTMKMSTEFDDIDMFELTVE